MRASTEELQVSFWVISDGTGKCVVVERNKKIFGANALLVLKNSINKKEVNITQINADRLLVLRAIASQ